MCLALWRGHKCGLPVGHISDHVCFILGAHRGCDENGNATQWANT